MRKLVIILISLFTFFKSFAQSSPTMEQVDSITATIDTNALLVDYTKVDSASFSSDTKKIGVYNYKKLERTGQVGKIERIGNGTCDSKEQYYFLDGKLIKAVIKMSCNDVPMWDSVIYFHNDTTFAQLDKATALYGPAFIQSAYNSLKKITQLERVQ